MTNRDRWWVRLVLAGGLALLTAPGSLRAQAPADKAASVFDDADKAATEKDKDKDKDKKQDKDKDQKKADAKDPKKPAAGTAADRDVIGFNQQNAASQMTELEERMFRLSEALRSLEPENASRLRLALKFSREELILDQMRETNKLLKDAQLHKAETEVRELVAKLEHLRDVLTAEDLDFQLKLARLRQMRETLGQLDRVVKEQGRVLGWTRFAIDQRQAQTRLAAAQADLAKLVGEGNTLTTETKAIANQPVDDAKLADRQKALRGLGERAGTLGKAAAALALNPIFADWQPSQLRAVEGQLADLASRLDGADLGAATTAAERAGATLSGEGDGLATRIRDAERDVAEAEFRRHQADQQTNRRATNTLGTGAARLGDAGIALQKEMIRAASSMESAERSLSHAAADSAANDQTVALETLGRASDDLSQSTERLLVELRTELQRRLVVDLTEMHEAQNSNRETTQAQAPRLEQKSRSAAITVAGLAQKEADLATRGEQFLALVEETEFGIALPTTLRILGREMRLVEGWLRAADASPRCLAFQQRIEDDLLTVVQSVRRLPPTTPPIPGLPLPSDIRERERELNRLVAELKLVRLLQSRLNDDTLGVDKNRAGAEDLPTNQKREVETLESNQEEIREALTRIAERVAQP